MVSKRRRRSRKSQKKWTPNVYWRSISPEDLRSHPLYVQLQPPKPGSSSIEDLQRYPQHSEVWNILHIGRLTTRHASAVLGLHESETAKVIGLPRSLVSSSRAKKAYRQLLEAPAPDIQIEEATKAAALAAADLSQRDDSANPWSLYQETDANPFNWARLYASNPAASQTALSDSLSIHEVRKAWGSAQEPTALLVAINFFAQDGTQIKESGICLLEAVLEEYNAVNDPLCCKMRRLQELGCRLGASPDGLLAHKDGSIECLEVKCLCPFTKGPSGFTVRDTRRSEEPKVPLCHIPQLQLEMLCTGPESRSTVLILLSVKEAFIFRVYRSEALLSLMLESFNRFWTRFVSKSQLPTSNFCENDENHHSLLKELRTCQAKSQLIGWQAGKSIQRGCAELLLFNGS